MSRCPGCGRKPSTDYDKAKSLILSTAYEIDGEYLGKTVAELKEIGRSIRKGDAYSFDESEVQRVVAYAATIESIPASRLAVDGLKWLTPPALFLFVLFVLWFWTSK